MAGLYQGPGVLCAVCFRGGWAPGSQALHASPPAPRPKEDPREQDSTAKFRNNEGNQRALIKKGTSGFTTESEFKTFFPFTDLDNSEGGGKKKPL